MAKPGPKPKPAAVKIAEGNRGKRKIIKSTVPGPLDLLPPTAPRAPSYLSPVAKREWAKLVPVLVQRGTVQVEDVYMLANFVEAVATLLEAREQLAAINAARRLIIANGKKTIKKMGARGKVSSTETSGGTMQVNPLLYIVRDQVGIISKLAAEFGLSPASRARLQLEARTAAPDAVDPLESILGGDAESDPADPVIQ